MSYPSAQAGYPGYAGYPGTMAARQTDSKAVVALVLAICTWVVCPVILAIISLVLAGQSDRDIDASGGILDGKALNTASKVISWANIALSVLAIIVMVIVIVVIPIALFVLTLFGAALGGVSMTEVVPTPLETGF